MQTRRMSAIEQVCSLFIGMVVSYIIQRTVFPLYGIFIHPAQDIQIIAIFTAASFVRGYWVRRFFNYLLRRKS